MNNKKNHILVISQYFYPEQFRINDMCKEWVKRGYKVTVLTGIPNYPYGKFFEGYGYTKKRRENWNGMDIIRIPLIARGKGAIGMVANYLSFVISGYIWKVFTKIKADYVFTYEVSPMTQALIGVWYSKKHNVPNYLYVQDLWPENVEWVTGIHSPLIIKPIEKMVQYIYQNCIDIFVTSPSFVEAVCKRGAVKEKVHYWPQYAEDFYQPIAKENASKIPGLLKEALKIVFTGNVGYAQGLDILPKAAEKLKECNVQFVIVGDGRYKERLIDEVKEKRVLDKFVFMPSQSPEEIPGILGACDIAFISFSNIDIFKRTIPAKLQSYMACGMPILASVEGETERIIREAKCGVSVPIGNIELLVEAILNYVNNNKIILSIQASNSNVYFEKHYRKQKIMDYIDGFFDK